MRTNARSPVPEGRPGPQPTPKTNKRSTPFLGATSTNVRRKIAVACEECRDRKRRCDGIRPRCGGCSKRGPHQECLYIQNTWKLGWPTSHFESSNTQIPQPGNDQLAEGASLPQLHDNARSTLRQALSSTSNGKPNHPQTASQSSNGEQLDENSLAISRNGRNAVNDRIQESKQPFQVHRSSININSDTQVGPICGRGDHMEVSDVLLTPAATMDECEIIAAQEPCVDAMGVTSGSETNRACEARTLDSTFFGPSSVVMFMSKVQHTIQNSKFISPNKLMGGHSSAGAQFGINRREPIHHGISRSEGTIFMNYESTDYFIPARSEADLFLESYFTNVHILNPIIHRDTFMEQYYKLWAARDPNADPVDKASDENFRNEIQRQIFYVTLNLIFALGCRSEPSLSAHERITKSERFFMRTQHARVFELLNYGSMELVQSMILMGRYLQATERSAKCWNVVGLAIRVAQGIGLHLESNNKSSYSQLEVEIRRRVWCCCLLLDRDLSMTYGRPCMVHHLTSRSTQIPSIIDDDLLMTSADSHVAQPEGTPSLMAFFVHSLTLSEILSEVLSTQYCQGEAKLRGGYTRGEASPEKATQFSDYQAVLLLDSSLTKWQRTLPQFLNDSGLENEEGVSGDTVRNEMFGHNPSLKSLYDLQALVLRVHRYHIRLLLLRPLLIALFDKEHGSSKESTDKTLLNTIFQQTMLTNFSNICVSTAQKQVDVLTDTAGKIRDPTHAWWYKVYYFHTCAIVILIGRLCPSIEGIGGQKSLAISWERCLRGLKGYFEFSQAAQKGYKALELIDERIFRQQTSDTRYLHENSSDDCFQYKTSMQIRRPAFKQNSEPVSELDLATPINDASALDSTPGNFNSPISPRTKILDEVDLNVNCMLSSSSDNPLIDAEIDINWSWNDLQLDWLNSMPFAEDFGGGGPGFD